MAEALAQAHWRNFLYASTARHWHALWCRYSPAGETRTAFNAERAFTPCEGGTEMKVVYHYRDERGTVSEFITRPRRSETPRAAGIA